MKCQTRKKMEGLRMHNFKWDHTISEDTHFLPLIQFLNYNIYVFMQTNVLDGWYSVTSQKQNKERSILGDDGLDTGKGHASHERRYKVNYFSSFNVKGFFMFGGERVHRRIFDSKR